MASADGPSDSGILNHGQKLEHHSQENSHSTLKQCLLELGDRQMPTTTLTSQQLIIQGNGIQTPTYPPNIEGRRTPGW